MTVEMQWSCGQKHRRMKADEPRSATAETQFLESALNHVNKLCLLKILYAQHAASSVGVHQQ